MKVVILAGGFGTRISEESVLKPKPMVEVGGYPILWHIMKHYSHYGFNDFIICAGYKQDVIKDYFASYFLRNSDVTFDLTDSNKMIVHNNVSEPWKVTIVDTGLKTMTGGRIRRIKKYINNETFMLTYGDGVSNININELVEFHFSHKKIVTMSSVKPEGRFGYLDMDENGLVKSFREKSREDTDWINIGFMVCEPQVFNYLKDDNIPFEHKPLTDIAKDGQLIAYKFNGFWQCMDTLRDKQNLDSLYESGKAPWKLW